MIIRSTYPDVAVPPVSLPEFLFDGLGSADEPRAAVLDAATGTGYTFGELHSGVRQVAAALARRGIR